MKTTYPLMARTALVALAYAASGLALLDDADAFTPVVMLWIPGGIALGAVTIWGRGALPGIAAGALALHLVLLGRASTMDAAWQMWMLAALLAAAAVIQAGIFGSALRRILSRDNLLTDLPGIAAFLLSAVALGPLLESSLLALTREHSDIMSMRSTLETLWLWWLSGALGALLIVPMFLVGWAVPRQEWRRRFVMVALPVATLTVVVAVACRIAFDQSLSRTNDAFSLEAVRAGAAMEKALAAVDLHIQSLSGLYAASVSVDRDEFALMAEHMRSPSDAVTAVEWVPVIAAGAVAAIEQEAREAGFADFKVFELDAEGARVPVTGKGPHYPVLFVEPFAGNESVLGYDLGSEPRRARALAIARDTGLATTTLPVKLSHSGEHGFRVFEPVYTTDAVPSTRAARRAALSGFTVGAYSLDRLIRGAESSLGTSHISMLDVDIAEPGDASPPPDPDPLATYWRTFTAFGMEWRVTTTPPPGEAARQTAWAALWIGLAGLVITMSSWTALLLAAGRTFRISELADRRTQELRARETMLLAAQQMAGLGSFHWDIRADKVTWSPETRRIFGIPLSTPIDFATYASRIDPDDAELVGSTIERTIAAGTEFQVEHSVIRDDGSACHVQAHGRCVLDADDHVIALVGVILDITDRATMEQHLRSSLETEQRAVTSLRELDKIKSNILSAVSHELRTPLTTLLGMTATMVEYLPDLDEETQLTMLGHMSTQGDRLDRLLTDLLDVDRIRRGIVMPRREATSIDELVAKTVRQAGIAVELDLPHVTSDVDPRMLERIVENLVVNADKHTPDGTTIWLQIRPIADGGVEIQVDDDGLGVAPGEWEIIFDPFQRGSSELGHSPGSGIGLALVAQYTKLHGGTATVGDRPGGGASFIVTFPSAEGATARPEAP